MPLPPGFRGLGATIPDRVTRCEVALRDGCADKNTMQRSATGEHLVHGHPTGLERLAPGTQVELPDPGALAPGETHGFVPGFVEALDPVAERPVVVVREALDVAGRQPGTLERPL